MDTPIQIALTPEQLAAVQAGDGMALAQDPDTHRVYLLIEQPATSTLGDDYFRTKIEEAFAVGGFEPLDMSAIKAEFLRLQIN